MTERDRDRPGEPIKGLPRRVRLPRAARSTDGAHWPTWRRLCGTDTADRRRDRWRTSVSATTKLMLGDAEVARIGLGANRLTNTPQHIALVKEAVVAGVNLIDTAHTYTGGESEETIGAALSPIPDGCIVATKGGWSAGRADVLRSEIEESLRRLRINSIALYYLHRPDPKTPLEESLAALKEYRDSGNIRHIGLSNVGIDQIQRARQVVPI